MGLTDAADGVVILGLPILEFVAERKEAVFRHGDPLSLAVVIYPLVVGSGSNLSITARREMGKQTTEIEAFRVCL